MASSSFDDEIESIQDPYLLVSLLLEEGEALSPKLREKILSMGSAAVQPLINMLNNEALQMERAPGRGCGPIHAVGLLGDIQAKEAIQPMLRWLAEMEVGEDILHCEIITALSKYGEIAYQPVLDAFEQAEDDDNRKSLCDVLVSSGIRNDRIFNMILAFFEKEKAYGALSFALYGDPRALDYLHQALAECEFKDESQNLFANQVMIDLSSAITELGGQLTPEEAQKLEKVNEQRSKNTEKIEAFFDQAEEEPRHPNQKPGRNDPCWCGSGKKYKHCHWQLDRNVN